MTRWPNLFCHTGLTSCRQRVTDVATQRRNRPSGLPNQFNVMYHATPPLSEYVTLRPQSVSHGISPRRVTSARIEFFSFRSDLGDSLCPVATYQARSHDRRRWRDVAAGSLGRAGTQVRQAEVLNRGSLGLIRRRNRRRHPDLL